MFLSFKDSNSAFKADVLSGIDKVFSLSAQELEDHIEALQSPAFLPFDAGITGLRLSPHQFYADPALTRKTHCYQTELAHLKAWIDQQPRFSFQQAAVHFSGRLRSLGIIAFDRALLQRQHQRVDASLSGLMGLTERGLPTASLEKWAGAFFENHMHHDCTVRPFVFGGRTRPIAWPNEENFLAYRVRSAWYNQGGEIEAALHGFKHEFMRGFSVLVQDTCAPILGMVRNYAFGFRVNPQLTYSEWQIQMPYLMFEGNCRAYAFHDAVSQLPDYVNAGWFPNPAAERRIAAFEMQVREREAQTRQHKELLEAKPFDKCWSGHSFAVDNDNLTNLEISELPRGTDKLAYLKSEADSQLARGQEAVRNAPTAQAVREALELVVAECQRIIQQDTEALNVPPLPTAPIEPVFVRGRTKNPVTDREGIRKYQVWIDSGDLYWTRLHEIEPVLAMAFKQKCQSNKRYGVPRTLETPHSVKDILPDVATARDKNLTQEDRSVRRYHRKMRKKHST